MKVHQDYALSALCLLANFHNIPTNAGQLRHQFDTDGLGLNQQNWLLAAKSLGLKAKIVHKPLERLVYLSLPAMLWRDDGNHFILAQIDEHSNRYLLQDLKAEEPIILNEQDFREIYQGTLIIVASRASVVESLAKFDFTWFIPAIIKYRHILLEVLFISVALQIFALISPLFFQVIMDKVLVHQSFSTLNVIAVGLLVVVIFEVLLGGIRTFIFSHTTSRIDVELGARLFRHLLSLPITYFESRRVGDTIARVKELEQIRHF